MLYLLCQLSHVPQKHVFSDLCCCPTKRRIGIHIEDLGILYMEDWRRLACQVFFWYDNNKDLKRHVFAA